MERAGTGLAKIMADMLRGAPPEEAPLLAWPLICGAAVAARTRALMFEDGVLRVEVSDARWRTQLADLAPSYVASFSQWLGNSAARVERVEFVLPAGRGSKR